MKNPSSSARQNKKPATKALDALLKRPDSSDTVPKAFVDLLAGRLKAERNALEQYAAHLRALDRKRLNSMGIKKQGFTERAFALAEINPDFLPRWLTLNKFSVDVNLFAALRDAVDITKQIEEMLWNLTVQASDMAYTDALEFYSQIQDAARRRIDAAEAPYEELHAFFKTMGKHPANADAPTQAKDHRRQAQSRGRNLQGHRGSPGNRRCGNKRLEPLRLRGRPHHL